MANFPAQVLQPDGAERRARDVDMVIVGNGIISGVGNLHLQAAAGVVVLDSPVLLTGQLDAANQNIVNVNSAVFDSLSGDAAFIEAGGGSTAAVSVVGRGRIRYDETTDRWQISQGGAAYIDIGTGSLAIGEAVAGGTPTAVLYIDAGGNLAQSAGLVYNDGPANLAVGGNASAATITATGLTPGRVTYAGAGGLLSDDAGLTFDPAELRLSVAGGHQMSDFPLPVSAVGTVRLRSFGGSFQASENGAAYLNVLVTGDNTLQSSYEASTGVPVDIQLAAVRGGIRILDVAAQTTPSFEVSSSASAQDSIMVTRTFAGAGIGIDVSMGATSTGVGINVSHTGSDAALQATASGSGLALNVTTSGTGQQASFTNVSDTATISTTFFRVPTVATGGTNVRLSDNGNFTGFLFELLHTGTGTGIQFVHSAGAGTSFNLNRSPLVATAGNALQITYGANTTGTMVNLSQAGSGIAFNLQSTGVGTTLQVGATGVSASAAIIFSASNSPTFNTSNTAATAVIANAFNRLPAAPIGGSILRLSSNVNFTGIGLEIISGAAAGSDTGIDVVMRGSGIGCVLHDQAANAHTGLLLRLQHDQTGSTGLLLEMRKSPAAATAGDLTSIIVGGNASGNIWAVTHGGSGDYESIAMTGAGRYLTLSHTVAGEVWRITGPAALVTSVLTTAGAMQLAAGTVGAPSFTFTLSATTGFFRSAADVVDLSIAGTSKYSFAAASLTLADALNLVVGTGTGTKIGTGTTQKLSVYGVAPVAQGAAIADAAGGVVIDAEARTALNALLARERAFGQIAP